MTEVCLCVLYVCCVLKRLLHTELQNYAGKHLYDVVMHLEVDFGFFLN